MGFTKKIWGDNGLYQACSKADKNAIFELLFCKSINTKDWHGAGWAAEAVSTNSFAKDILLKYLSENQMRFEGQLALFNLCADYNCNGGYFTTTEFSQIRYMLFSNWNGFLKGISENIPSNTAVVSQISEVVNDDGYIEDRYFTQEQIKDLEKSLI